MQIGVKILVGVSVLTASALGLSSLGLLDKKSGGRRVYTEHTYYYYPKANFYYDSSSANYIFYDSSSASWKKTSTLPEVATDLGKSVRLGQHPHPVWQENKLHRMVYAVSLYSSKNDWKKQERITSRPKPTQKKKKKSGLAKFFDDLFS